MHVLNFTPPLRASFICPPCMHAVRPRTSLVSGDLPSGHGPHLRESLSVSLSFSAPLDVFGAFVAIFIGSV